MRRRRTLTVDQLGGSPHTIVIPILVNLEPFGVCGVKGSAITVAGSHVVKDGAKMVYNRLDVEDQ